MIGENNRKLKKKKTDKGLNYKIYKQSYNSMPEKSNNPIKKWGKDLTDISPKKTYRQLRNT